VPPLRERKQDIPLLAGHILERVARTAGVQRNISDDALKLMLNYAWPGNVRELENCLERACALTSGPTIRIADLPTAVQNFHPQVPVVPVQEESSGIEPLAEMEKRAILHAIANLNGDKLEAAKQLQIGKTTLYRKLKEYGSIV
jgi:two-component system response regulator HydG